MKHIVLPTVCLVTLLAVFACASQKKTVVVTPQEISTPVLASSAAPEPAPATQPTSQPALPEIQPPLPPGHPNMEQMQAAQQGGAGGAAPGQLPSGHPDIAKMKAQGGVPPGTGGMPPGTGGMPPGMGGGAKLPAGHPDISQMRKNAAATQPSLIGTILVRAVQGTKDAPAIGAGSAVTLEMYQQDQVIQKREAKLDVTGCASFERVPVGMNTTPVARVTYNGVDYEAAGTALDPTHPDQQVQVSVFETTHKEPAWQVKMQHIMLQPAAEGVQVMEMLAVENPSDRSWLGAAPNAEGKRATLVLPLPAGAKDVQLAGGFHDGSAKVDADKITNSMPLVPGVSQFRVVYTLPVKDGKAELALSTPAAVGHLMAMIPDDGTTINAVGLENGGTANMGNGVTRFYKATDVKAGASFKLSISGITATTGAAAATSETPAATGVASTATATAASGQMAKILAGAGGLFIFVVGGMVLLVKSPKSSKNAKKAKQ